MVALPTSVPIANTNNLVNFTSREARILISKPMLPTPMYAPTQSIKNGSQQISAFDSPSFFTLGDADDPSVLRVKFYDDGRATTSNEFKIPIPLGGDTSRIRYVYFGHKIQAGALTPANQVTGMKAVLDAALAGTSVSVVNGYIDGLDYGDTVESGDGTDDVALGLRTLFGTDAALAFVIDTDTSVLILTLGGDGVNGNNQWLSTSCQPSIPLYKGAELTILDNNIQGVAGLTDVGLFPTYSVNRSVEKIDIKTGNVGSTISLPGRKQITATGGFYSVMNIATLEAIGLIDSRAVGTKRRHQGFLTVSTEQIKRGISVWAIFDSAEYDKGVLHLYKCFPIVTLPNNAIDAADAATVDWNPQPVLSRLDKFGNMSVSRKESIA